VNRRGRRPLLALAGAATALGLLFPLSASGTNWGASDSTPPPGVPSILCTGWPDEDYFLSECTANTNLHYMYISSPMHSQLRTALENSLAHDFGALPEVGTVLETSPSSVTDVWVFYSNEDPTLPVAFTYCAESPAVGWNHVRYHMWCQPQYIVFQNTTDGNGCWNYGPCRRHYACHEIGHTLGLQHTSGSTSCMSYSTSHPEGLRPHDEEHLIDCYPHSPSPYATYPAETRSDTCKYPGE
jgi:hypothetical protein